jgi:ParB family chromosome partitioning protein
LLQPIVVRPLSGFPGKYEIIAGERRWRASQRVGLDEIPVIVKNTDEQESLELALIENLQRENLNPLEEARAFQEFVDKYGMTHEALAQKLGKSRSLVANALRLLKLPESISQLLLEGTLSNGHARALIALEDPVVQGELAKRIVAEGLSVRETEALINQLKAARSIKKKIQKNYPVESNTRWLEDQFRQIFGTKVKLYERGNKGRLVIEFFSKEELNRLYTLVAKSSPVSDYVAEEEKVYAV